MIPTYPTKIIQKVNLAKLTFPPENVLSENYESDDFELFSNESYVNMQGWNWKGYDTFIVLRRRL